MLFVLIMDYSMVRTCYSTNNLDSFTAKKKEENQTPFDAITCYLISFLLFFLLHQEGILPPMVFVY